MPRVSIIVPSYNHARFLSQCARSVIGQTFRDWEMIVVDDASSDDSVALWKSIDDDRIHVHENEGNLGTYANLNRGVERSTSEYVAILNSDDWWEPTKLAKQVEALDRCPDAPFSYTRGWLPNESGDVDPSADNYQGWPLEERLDLVPYILDFNRLMASSVVFRRPWAEFDESLQYSGDWIASLRASYFRPPVGVLEPLTFWRQHGENTSKRFVAVTREEVRVRRALVWGRASWYLPRVDRALVDRRIGNCAYHLSAIEMLWNCVAESRLASRLALRLLPDKRMALRRAAMCHLPRWIALKRFFPGRSGRFDRADVDSQPKIDFRLPKPQGGWPVEVRHD